MSAPYGCSPFCQECGSCTVRQAVAPRTEGREALIDTIVGEVIRSLSREAPTAKQAQRPAIPLGVSNRHLHLREESFKTLFGADAKPQVYRNLYQPNEYALTQTCIIAGPKMRTIHDVRILGPFRNYDQVEISFTDAVVLGLNPPVRDSGKLAGAAPITVVGPAGSIVLKEGAIIANRHLHMTNSDAAAFGVAAGDFVAVEIPGEKSTRFGRVLVRTNDAWKLQLHLDTDDANAAHVRCNQEAVFIGKE